MLYYVIFDYSEQGSARVEPEFRSRSSRTSGVGWAPRFILLLLLLLSLRNTITIIITTIIIIMIIIMNISITTTAAAAGLPRAGRSEIIFRKSSRIELSERAWGAVDRIELLVWTAGSNFRKQQYNKVMLNGINNNNNHFAYYYY